MKKKTPLLTIFIVRINNFNFEINRLRLTLTRLLFVESKTKVTFEYKGIRMQIHCYFDKGKLQLATDIAITLGADKNEISA